MKKYKVYYTIYSNMEWHHEDKIEIINAESKEQARKIIEDRSNYGYDFSVSLIEEVHK